MCIQILVTLWKKLFNLKFHISKINTQMVDKTADNLQLNLVYVLRSTEIKADSAGAIIYWTSPWTKIIYNTLKHLQSMFSKFCIDYSNVSLRFSFKKCSAKLITLWFKSQELPEAPYYVIQTGSQFGQSITNSYFL